MKNLKEWFIAKQEELSIDVHETRLGDMQDWQIIEDNGIPHYIGHVSKNYHRGVFLSASETGREGYVERFMLAPIPVPEMGEIYGVALLAKFEDKYLVQAKSEPGNDTPNHVQLTSTIQASHINIMKGLSGKIAFTELYTHVDCKSYVISQDGAQLYMKKNKVCYIDLTEAPSELPSNFTWATREEIEELAQEGLVSEHVMQCLGVSVLSR